MLVYNTYMHMNRLIVHVRMRVSILRGANLENVDGLIVMRGPHVRTLCHSDAWVAKRRVDANDLVDTSDAADAVSAPFCQLFQCRKGQLVVAGERCHPFQIFLVFCEIPINKWYIW